MRVQRPNSTLSADTDKPLRRNKQLARTELQRKPPRDNTGRRKASSLKRSTVSPASSAQREKVRAMGFCIACGKPLTAYRAIDPAHVIDRSLGGCDAADCVVPLCRTFDGGCHKAYDEYRLELLPILERDGAFRAEQAHAVMHLGVAGAYERLTGYKWKRPA